MPAADVQGDLYECPAGKRAIISVSANSTESAAAVAEILITYAPGGALDDEEQTQFYGDLGLKDSFAVLEGWKINAGDVIRVRSSTGTVAFAAHGEEYDV